VRGLLIFLLLLPMLAVGADDGTQYAGRRVVDVIEEFRNAGEPFAYSTNLVRADLLVAEEPAPGSPLDIVRQVLRPHGLTVEERAGVYLVMRFDAESLELGQILLIITAPDGGEPPPQPAVTVVPGLGSSTRIKPGIYEYTDVAPGRYAFSIEAAGFALAQRLVDVWPGETKVVSVGLDIARPEIETISVSVSRYEILRDIAASRFAFDQRTIQGMPDVGEDPLRVVQRLPGAAASGTSAKTYLRGGEQGEIGIMLNGQWLFDPFHVRDYQSIFSAVDSRAIEGVEVYTGGFPARFGNRMSGLVLMQTLEAPEARHSEVGISVFNTSLLTSGNESDRNWLLSARRGNLDLVIDPKFGQPSYYDVFGQYTHEISSDTSLSVNGLFARDNVELILETDPAELERALSRTRNAQLWVQLDNRWSSELSSQTVLSAVSFANRRNGSLNDQKKIVGTVEDIREIRQFGLRQDFTLRQGDGHLVQWGLQVVHGEAEYDYQNTAEYYALQALYDGQEDTRSLVASAAPDGASYALYFADRWKIAPRSILEWGLRWDDQSYTDTPSDSQLSPRLSFLQALGPDTQLRLSWGRYYQPQQINELQIEDGITSFWPAQRADHFIAGIQHLFRNKYSLRLEMFDKEMREVRPRFENLFYPLGLIPEIQPDRVRLDPQSARSRGLEVSLDRSGGPFTWWTSYVLSEVTDRIDGRDQLRSWDQRHALQGGLSWSNEKWDVAMAANIHSGWPLTELHLVENGVDEQGEAVYVAIPGQRNVGRHPAFASLDFRVSRKWKLSRGSFMAFLEVSNLTNRQNECCLDWDLLEDTQTGEPTFELERGLDYWMPLLPAIGVLWEF